MDKNKETEKPSSAGKIPPLVLVLAGLVVGIILALVIYRSTYYVSTDDAFVDGDVVVVSPKVGAHVLRVAVEDNQAVKAGDLLAELDPRDFDVRVKMATAELDGAKAEDTQAQQDVVRYKKLVASDEISEQQMDQAVLRARMAEARVAGAKAALQKAELDLSYTKIVSPATGHVARKSIEVGSFVQPGQALMAVVADEKWVVANFKETELSKMRPGQSVAIRIDACPGKVWNGTVDSMQRGTGARFSLFPPENATGNFVKVVQRVPVKIIFDENPDNSCPLAVGMSVVPEVRVR